jgi:dipeptidyl aminopeptidase/acylaminoacyl peptidase
VKSFYLLASVALASAAIAVPPQATPVPRISTTAFAERSTFLDPMLSPDGTKLLARMTSADGTALAVADLAGTGLEALTLPADSELVRYRWAGNGRVLFVMGAQVPWFGRGDRYVTRAFAYDLVTHKTVPVGPKVQGTSGDDIIWVDPEGKELLMVSQPDQFHYPSVFRASLETGKTKLEQGPYDYMWSWYADKSGVVRGGYGYRENGWFTKYRANGGAGYQNSPSVAYKDRTVDAVVRLLDGTDESFAYSSKKTGRRALYRYNLATQQLGELVYENPTNDIDDADFDEKTGALTSVSFTDDSARTIWFDETLKQRYVNLGKTFRDRSIATLSSSRDKNRQIIWVGSPTDPGAYYLYEPASGAVRRLAKVADKIDRAGLSTTKPVSYKARDGLDIPAYLTLPVGREAKGLPLIIMPHGGPYGVRDTLGYDAEVQLLANRGYAVLQPNYRGSSGYGLAFEDKGKGQWGRAMQDDVDDGMDWLVKQGIVDAGRVCIVGASYGGYVALWGATRNPERYRCAVSFAGVSDLKDQLNYQTDFLIGRGDRREWEDTVKGDKSFNLLQVSPISRVADLKVPVMLVHGDKDKRVLPRQSTQYDRALTAAGKPNETYIVPGAGHGFDKPSDQKAYLDRLEAFLAKHNPA